MTVFLISGCKSVKCCHSWNRCYSKIGKFNETVAMVTGRTWQKENQIP